MVGSVRSLARARAVHPTALRVLAAVLTLAVLAWAWMFSAPAHAETGEPAFGPAVGAPAPHDLSLVDQAGGAQSLEVLLSTPQARNGVVVYFNRSLDWCPVCKKQTIDVDARLNEFTERGYAVATITTDTSEQLARFAERREIQSVLLADPERDAVRAFDVLDPVFADREPGSRGYALPFPSAFVLDSDGLVVARLFEIDSFGDRRGYVDRITVDVMLETLDGLSAES